MTEKKGSLIRSIRKPALLPPQRTRSVKLPLASSDVTDTFEVVILDEVPEVKHVELIQPKQDSLEDLLQRLKDEEQAQKELDEYNKTHNNNNNQ